MAGALVPLNARKKLAVVRKDAGLTRWPKNGFAIHSLPIVWLPLTMPRGSLRSWDIRVRRCFMGYIASWCCRKKPNDTGRSLQIGDAINLITLAEEASLEH